MYDVGCTMYDFLERGFKVRNTKLEVRVMYDVGCAMYDFWGKGFKV
jgi:hypothetical protein